MNLLREYIRGLLKEDPMGFVHDLADAHEEFGEEGQPFFGGDPGKGGGKAIKRAFAANADYSFLNSLDTVHWGGIYGLMDLKGKGKDELSATMTLPGEDFESAGPNAGLWIKGRITLAANDQDQLYTGHYRTLTGDIKHDPESAAAKRQAQMMRSSGVAKRPTVSKDYSRYGKLKRGDEFSEKMARNMPYVLDKSTWHKGIAGETNEALVDNWKPVGIVLAKEDYIDAIQGLDYIETKKDVKEETVGVIKQIMLTAIELGVPVYDYERDLLWSPK